MKQPFQIDGIDRRIVRELQRDANLSHAALGERVGASPASAWRRVRALEQEGVLGKAVRLADPAALGRAVNVLCQIRMTRQTVEARAEFEMRGVLAHPSVAHAASNFALRQVKYTTEIPV